MKDQILKKGEIKLIVFLDGDQEKDKAAKILEVDQYGVSIELWNLETDCSLGVPVFFLPWHRITKVKEVKR